MKAPGLVEIYGTAPAIPKAVKIHDVIYASRLSGVDPQSGELPQGLDLQTSEALHNMEALLQAAGASKENVGRVTAFVSKVENRESFYKPWDLMYPDPQDRPAAKVLVSALPERHLIELEVVAIVGGRRQRFDIEGVNARDPTVKIGNWVFSSRVNGTDPRTGKVPPDIDSQSRLAFQNIKTLIELAGGDIGNIVQITTFGNNASYIPAAKKAFEELFSDRAQRPPFHGLEAYIRPHLALMVEMIAVL